VKWEKDLIRDIRTHSPYDNVDHAPYVFAPFEISECNASAVYQKFMSVRDRCRAILEIGVDNNNDKSITRILLDNKLENTIYVGLDIKDKTYLNDQNKNIYTIQNDSLQYQDNLEKIRSFGVDQFDFIFIDGWHSINHMLGDWEYTNLLSSFGIVGIHDVRLHPGPSYFIKSLNQEIWNVEENVCPTGEDYGVGFVQKKSLKMGISLVGGSFGYIGLNHNAKDWRLTCDNIKSNLFDGFPNKKVYTTTYNSETIPRLLDFYNPTKALIIPYTDSHQRTTYIQSLKNLVDEDVDFIISTRFDIEFSQPVYNYNFNFNKFNFMFREIEPYWSDSQFVSDSLFAFPKKYLKPFIEAIEREHNSPYRILPDLHAMYRHMSYIIGVDNIHFLHEGCWNSNENPIYKIIRGRMD
jgi:hypothetical protein